MKSSVIAAVLGILMMTPAAAAPAVPARLKAELGQPLYLDFWASWCAPCAQSFPWLNEMHARYGDRIRIIGVNVDTKREDAERFLKRRPANFKIIYDPGGKLAETYALQAMPSAVLLDAKGQVLWQHGGFRSDEIAQYEAAIQKALQ